jgi:hypothetical protein
MYVSAPTDELLFHNLSTQTMNKGVMMKVLKIAGLWLSIMGVVLIAMGSAQAAMVSTPEIFNQMDRTQIVSMLERADVQKQLTEMGVDPVAALARVDQMTGQELAQLNGHLNELSAGAGVSTVELLLIILLVVIVF